MSRHAVSINARFLGEPLTGLQRWGREVLLEFDEMIGSGEIDPDLFDLRLLVPSRPQDMPPYRHLKLQVARPLKSHPWEQMVLPFAAKGFLLNLKNTAPVRHPRMSVQIQDLQPFARPDTHTALFNRVYKWILPRASRRARALFALSQSTADEIERFFGIPASGITVTGASHEHVLRIEADTGILQKHDLPRSGYLLAVSSLNPNKNFAAILRAMRMADVHVPLVIAGGTNPKVFEGAGVEELPANAIHVGRVTDQELRALYENALGFVYPSFYEGWGLPPGEAMILGCPVISSHTTSLPEVCGDSVLYCDPADDESIAKQLFRLVEDGPKRQELAAMGRAHSLGFTWRDVARRIWKRVEPEILARN